MNLHKLLYWPHLICGVVAGLVILLMSVTGVLLTYERQIIAWGESDYDRSVPDNSTALSIDDIIINIEQATGDTNLRSIKIDNNPEASIVIRGQDYYYTNPYTGEILGNGPKSIKAFFSEMRSLHRWFSMEGENRNTARMITGAANLMFLFIVISGIYLWFPKVVSWQNIKKVIFFRKTKSARARDFNWHNVFGIWSAVPLIVVIATATVFYYSWANDLVYYLAGEEPPARGSSSSVDVDNPEIINPASYESMFQVARSHQENWRSITMNIPANTDSEVRFTLDKGNGGEPTKRGDLSFDRTNGTITTWVPFSDNTAGRQARLYIRFLHTGEALGIIGQTVAGLVSLFATIMMWTGLALAYRKYIKPRLSKKALNQT